MSGGEWAELYRAMRRSRRRAQAPSTAERGQVRPQLSGMLKIASQGDDGAEVASLHTIDWAEWSPFFPPHAVVSCWGWGGAVQQLLPARVPGCVLG